VPKGSLERIGLNEAAFRRINEDIGRGREAEDDTTLVGFVCECGQADCSRLIEMTPAEYERLRADARHFAVVAGHEIPFAECVVERTDRYHVVEKRPQTAPLAEETDPRQ
jgi:hypothetical protein